MTVDPGQKLMKGLLEAFILESLAQEPKHGYALLKEMEECFGQEPNRNKIYPLLQRLQKNGLIREVPDASEEERGRTLYTLTEDGESELAAYRRLPEAFKATVGRLWPGAMRRVVPSGPPEPATGPARAQGPGTTGEASRDAPEGGETRPDPPTATDAGTPYPCVDARVALEKDPRTGNLSIRLTGCPMGAFDYCPLCPVYKSVQGLRVITFGGL